MFAQCDRPMKTENVIFREKRSTYTAPDNKVALQVALITLIYGIKNCQLTTNCLEGKEFKTKEKKFSIFIFYLPLPIPII